MGKIAEAVKAGDRRGALEAMAAKLAESLDEAEQINVVAQIAARLQAVLEELESLPDAEGSSVDDLAARRKARRAEADAGMRAKRRRRTEQRS